jgi:hypothetical protein
MIVRKETTMRSSTLTSLAAGGRALLRRIDAYTRWAFNPQPELTSRYER